LSRWSVACSDGAPSVPAGTAVNLASRLEALTKQLEERLFRAFNDFVKSDFDLECVGEYPARGFSDPIELFAYQL
jgi:adenylate cyclase